MGKYVVYILECRDGTYYTGITNHLDKRLEKHQAGKGAKYTRGRTPVQLRYLEWVENKSEALQREYKIKKMSRYKKQILIKSLGVLQNGYTITK
ncbi:GIY-YIG nuclease family protein [Hazenella sp. IB182357]|uniref:GIY-YIG nuclease family protein n=1 Tax=Polycladospora coralii TaxID=2771432 RepID=A0A926NFQ5_9BACL|nr:GIY-YIG nuclease family protein [Polycladospora coralii]